MQKLLVGVNLTPLWLNTHSVDEVEAEGVDAPFEVDVGEEAHGMWMMKRKQQK